MKITTYVSLFQEILKAVDGERSSNENINNMASIYKAVVGNRDDDGMRNSIISRIGNDALSLLSLGLQFKKEIDDMKETISIIENKRYIPCRQSVKIYVESKNIALTSLHDNPDINVSFDVPKEDIDITIEHNSGEIHTIYLGYKDYNLVPREDNIIETFYTGIRQLELLIGDLSELSDLLVDIMETSSSYRKDMYADVPASSMRTLSALSGKGPIHKEREYIVVKLPADKYVTIYYMGCGLLIKIK